MYRNHLLTCVRLPLGNFLCNTVPLWYNVNANQTWLDLNSLPVIRMWIQINWRVKADSLNHQDKVPYKLFRINY